MLCIYISVAILAQAFWTQTHTKAVICQLCNHSCSSTVMGHVQSTGTCVTSCATLCVPQIMKPKTKKKKLGQADEPCQTWIITDVVAGPWQDPLSELQRTASQLQHVNVLVHDEFVNVFRLQPVLESHGPFDLVVSFGSWPNVLTNEICLSVTETSPLPGQERRTKIQSTQKRIFNYPTINKIIIYI